MAVNPVVATVQVSEQVASVDILLTSSTVEVSGVQSSTVEISGVTIVKETSNATFLLRLETVMQAGVLTYVLPSVPPENGVQVFINGLQVSAVVNGVNLTITGYSAGEIESDDVLKVYY